MLSSTSVTLVYKVDNQSARFVFFAYVGKIKFVCNQRFHVSVPIKSFDTSNCRGRTFVFIARLWQFEIVSTFEFISFALRPI